MDETSDHLKEMQQSRPLGLYWLKRDYVSHLEAVFIYYNIEPILQDLLQGPIEEYLQLFDIEHLWETMIRSDLPYIYGKGLLLRDFLEFLVEKKFTIPPHLRSDKFESTDVEGDEDIRNLNLLPMRPVQLQRLHARTFAAIAWKDESYKDISANALVRTNNFKKAMELVGAGNIDPETQAEWISDLSPRSKKRKKQS